MSGRDPSTALPLASRAATSLRMTSAEKAFTITYRKFFAYIPGSFIPAIRRAKLGLPICLNIFFICAY